MSERSKERMLDLLTDQVLFGLSSEELAELKELENLYPELKGDSSLELTASAIGLNNLESIEPLPAHLRSKILADADNFFKTEENPEENSTNVLSFQPKTREAAPVDVTEPEVLAKVIEFKTQSPTVKWLGWAVAAAACVVLALNVWFTRIQTPDPPDAAEQRAQLLKETDIIKADWAEPDPNKKTGITGDVVWSNKDQKGYLRLKGLPKNDTSRESYQLWIFDANQSDKTPIDGGVFDVGETGEVIIPIDAKIKVQKPQMFAVTAEKPGGVVVSDRGKLMTIAKVPA